MKSNPTMSLTDIVGQLSGGMIPAGATSEKIYRELYMGLPPGLTAAQMTPHLLVEFIGAAMQQAGLSTLPGNCVMNARAYPEKNFAFVEFRTTEEATNALILTGTYYMGLSCLKFKRPSHYDAPPDTPGAVQTSTGLGTQTKTLMVAGLPKFMNETQVKEFLQAFGALAAMNLVKGAKGQSMGSALFEYADPAHTTVAMKGLNGLQLGGCRRIYVEQTSK